MQVVNKKMCVIVILVLVIIESCTLFLMYKSFSNKNNTLDEVNLNINNANMFAIMLEQSDGTYKEDKTSTWPTSGYTYNESMSGCIDINGNRIEDALTYDKENNKANVNTTNTSYCYLYFSIKPPTFSEKIINESSSNNDLIYIGNGYRYVGANPNNYLTFNNETWRIIGFFDGSEIGLASGQYYAKIIKNESIGTYAYDEMLMMNLWEETTLYTYLNNDYYNGLSSDSKEMIANAKWWYHLDSIDAVSVDNLYSSIRNYSDRSVNSFIGLSSPEYWIYSHDDLSEECLEMIFSEFKGECFYSYWLPITHWSIVNDGEIYALLIGSANTMIPMDSAYNVMPVVYLISDVTIKGLGDGSENNKYEIEL